MIAPPCAGPGTTPGTPRVCDPSGRAVHGHTLRCHPDAMSPPVIAVVGPTAAGKSALSLRLARSLGGEVVNADSMQLYRGMDIGTAKLPADQREGVPHHLLDVWEVTRAASVSEYQRLARQVIQGLYSRGQIPIVVGGSGLEVGAVIDTRHFPGTDRRQRDRRERELAEIGAPALHPRLTRLDPA